MKFYNTFKRSNGNFTTQEFSGAEMLNFDIFKLVLFLVIGSLVAVLTAGICLIVRLFDYDSNDKTPSYLGIIVSLYLLIDHAYGWFVSLILYTVEGGDIGTLDIIMTFNLAFLITHILLLIFGDTIYFNTEDTSIRKQTLILCTVVCLGVSYLISTPIYPLKHSGYGNIESVKENKENDERLAKESIAKEKDDKERYSNCK